MFEPRATVGGDTWALLETCPRMIAESFRRALEVDGVPSVLRTPYGWVMSQNVIEVETGAYQGDVGLYVPEVFLQRARDLIGEPDDSSQVAD
jgi:hypothetical protein